jgi:DNA polymerase-1
MAKSFKEMVSGDKDTILIVDALNLAFRYKHSKRRDFAEDYVNTVHSLAHSYKASEVIIACDKGASSYRTALLPEYKGNRKAKYEKQTEQEAKEFKDFLGDFEKTVLLLEKYFKVFRFQGVEADDIAAYITQVSDKNIWMVSSDKDWDLLISPKVSRFSYVTRKEITEENWSEHYEVSKEEYISFKCLTGDSGDNVPGVTGVGPKRAVGLIKQYGSAFDIADQLPIASKYKYIQNLNDFGADAIYKNYELMDLVTYSAEAIGAENILEIDNHFKK